MAWIRRWRGRIRHHWRGWRRRRRRRRCRRRRRRCLHGGCSVLVEHAAVWTLISQVASARAFNTPSLAAASVRACRVRAYLLGTRAGSNLSRIKNNARGGGERVQAQIASRRARATIAICAYVKHIRAWIARARRLVAVLLVARLAHHTCEGAADFNIFLTVW